MELQEEEEEEEGKAGCFLLLPPLTGQRSTCTYLTLPTSSRTCDYPYRLQKLKEGEEFSARQLHGYSPPPSLLHAYLLSSHKITDNTEYQLSPHLSTKARAKPSKQKKNRRSASPKYNKKKLGPTTPPVVQHPIPSHRSTTNPSPLLSNKKKAYFSFRKPVKAKLLLACRGGKKTATSLALSRCVCRNGLPYLTLRCLALPYQVGTYLCVRYHVV